MTNTILDISADLLDVRDLIARREELEACKSLDEYEYDELKLLTGVLDELRGQGGDERWRGSWYPVTLVSESYFKDYAQEMAENVGAISRNEQWPLNHIDWNAAAEALKTDYASITIDGNEYWYR